MRPRSAYTTDSVESYTRGRNTQTFYRRNRPRVIEGNQADRLCVPTSSSSCTRLLSRLRPIRPDDAYYTCTHAHALCVLTILYGAVGTRTCTAVRVCVRRALISDAPRRERERKKEKWDETRRSRTNYYINNNVQQITLFTKCNWTIMRRVYLDRNEAQWCLYDEPSCERLKFSGSKYWLGRKDCSVLDRTKYYITRVCVRVCV